MRFRKQRRAATDPSWLFSTWPIPSWDGRLSSVRLEPSGEDDTPRIQKALDRLGAISGSLRLIDGTFLLSEPIDLTSTEGSMIIGSTIRQIVKK